MPTENTPEARGCLQRAVVAQLEQQGRIMPGTPTEEDGAHLALGPPKDSLAETELRSYRVPLLS
jgi:hypothetical protein